MTTSKIENYRFGIIIIDGNKYTRDVIILPDRILTNWRRSEGHYLQVDDINTVLEAVPEVLIVGQGSISRMKIGAGVEEAVNSAGIKLISLPTKDACREYNSVSQKRPTAAALHLTC